MVKTYLMTIAYDGTDYHGWQRQVGQRTVQQALEEALCGLIGAQVAVTASGRTDEGVHALGQTVSFAAESSIPPENIPAALNGRLPADIRVISCKEAGEGFDARKAAKRKTYVYRLYESGAVLPQFDRFAERVNGPLDLGLLRKACAAVVGEHDFVDFHCLGSSAKTTVRTIYSCEISEYPPHGITPKTYEIRICGNGFLYKMVRLIVGALLRLSDGEITLDEFTAALDGAKAEVGDQKKMKKIPAPGKGLTLLDVEYTPKD